MVDVMSEEFYRQWLPKGWKIYKEQISDFLSSYENMSEKDRKKSYKKLAKELSGDVMALGRKIPSPVEGYRDLSIRLKRSNLDDEKKATEDLGEALLFMGYQMVEDKSEINLLFFKIVEEGRIQGVTEIIDYIQNIVDNRPVD